LARKAAVFFSSSMTNMRIGLIAYTSMRLMRPTGVVMAVRRSADRQ
jgi:hypothetical protein